MRLIDVDALNLDHEVEMADNWKTAHEIANHVKYAHTIDAVPVVRCEECKHQDYCAKMVAHTTRDHVLELDVIYYHKIDFCSRGERREYHA